MSKRITYKCTRPNPLFEEWLVTLLEEAKQTKSKLIPMLQEALTSITKYPLPLNSGAECAILQGFDRRLCVFIDKRLEVYNDQLESKSGSSNSQKSSSKSSSPTKRTQNQSIQHSESTSNTESPSISPPIVETPSGNSTDEILTKRLRSNQESGSLPGNSGKKNAKGPKTYKPAFRSGGFAILIALLEHSQENTDKPSLTKEQLIDKAQKYSEESFVRPKPESFYTAWSNMSKLIAKGLVVKSRHKKIEFSLTVQGSSLATELLKEHISRPTVNDIIFNNASSSSGVLLENNNSDNINNISDIETVNPEEFAHSMDMLIEMPAGSFDIILLIDKNETGGVSKKNDPTVAQFKKFPDLKHEYRSLKVGDFTWIARHKLNVDQELVLPYVIERKRMDDLGASIKDGRFHEQKFRLRKCGLDNVIYLVEQYGGNKHVGLPVQSLMQALANTRIQDGFKVHITDSFTNSARFLAMMTKRLTIEYKTKNLKGSIGTETKSLHLMTFEYFNKSSVKTKALTVTEAFIKMLLQLKGVSVEKALAITKKYNTPRSLMKAYENCNDKEGQSLLSNLKFGDLSRNVGPNTSKAVYHLFSNIDGD